MSLLGGNSVSSWAEDETHGGGPRYGETTWPGNVSAAFNAGQATSAANMEGNSDIVAARPQRKPLLFGQTSSVSWSAWHLSRIWWAHRYSEASPP
ncbi:hypothetical protein TcBrA4_0002090 [Trypanosoma cruzi]|nr:hypothetical protein TcBrA4_0002090 [Trypanosoma cruzi]